ncbi:hypothetical protein [Gelidibacter japonicus]|nr:hypothetical protein [Gelidibacter japonicus]
MKSTLRKDCRLFTTDITKDLDEGFSSIFMQSKSYQNMMMDY